MPISSLMINDSKAVNIKKLKYIMQTVLIII